MAKAYVVGNPKSKRPEKRAQRGTSDGPRRPKRTNPLEAVITGLGFNPHRERSSMAKSKSKKKSHGGASAGALARRHSGGNPHQTRHHRHAKNPILPAGQTWPKVGAMVVGGAAGGVGTVWLPNLVLGSKDVGIFGYVMNIIVAVLGAMGLNAAGFPNGAVGWLIGGGVALVGRVIDDQTGKQIIEFSAPIGSAAPGTAGLGQFYRTGQAYLPTGSQTDLTSGHQRMSQAPPVVVQAAPAAVKTGMGWSAQFRRAA
ncbi:MAG TPA: hypothetical protein VGR84_19175 [Candidatus Acidoferrales bacterium]|nr:hypothetical protein [Candidatus Acidoferrales bacterium]